MKYNRKDIMTTAWNIRKQYGISLSIALKSAWALAKAVNEASERVGFYCGHSKVDVKIWAKGDKVRAYVSTKHWTNAWHLKHVDEFGYVDIVNGVRVAA